ncbi:hypothetical protein D9756_006952 [Leucocoprinus leucothites]|uniref:Uncharacterized protein n=1 Tax=Leucocoprinus leucothites TaxID=201217 RepID=A0A8H5FY59_9AGAR|nr:hypothetical protein D9756_006952 [Leucoagaricus leucothites]
MVNTSLNNNSSTTVAKDSLAPLRSTRYTCFVIPSRLALFVFTLIILLFAIGFAVVGWVISAKLGKGCFTALGEFIGNSNLDQQLLEIERLALFFHILIYFILALFAAVGVYGAVQKSARYTSLFASTILGQLVFNIASGALCLYLLFRNGSNGDPSLGGYRQCMDVIVARPDDFFLRNLCERSPLMRGLSLGLYVFMWLTEIMAVILSNQYLAQLHEEAAQMEMLNPPSRESFYC